MTFEVLKSELSDKKQKLEKKTNDYEKLKEKVFLIDENIGKIRKELDKKTKEIEKIHLKEEIDRAKKRVLKTCELRKFRKELSHKEKTLEKLCYKY